MHFSKRSSLFNLLSLLSSILASTISLHAFPSGEGEELINTVLHEEGSALFSEESQRVIVQTSVQGMPVMTNHSSGSVTTSSLATSNQGLGGSPIIGSREALSAPLDSEGDLAANSELQDRDLKQSLDPFYTAVGWKVAPETMAGLKATDLTGSTAIEGSMPEEARVLWERNSMKFSELTSLVMVLNTASDPVPFECEEKGSFTKVIPTIVPRGLKVVDSQKREYSAFTQNPTPEENRIIRILIKTACARYYGDQVVQLVERLSNIDAPDQVNRPLSLQACVDIMADIGSLLEEKKISQKELDDSEDLYPFLSPSTAQQIIRGPILNVENNQARFEAGKRKFDEVNISSMQAGQRLLWHSGEVVVCSLAPGLAGMAASGAIIGAQEAITYLGGDIAAKYGMNILISTVLILKLSDGSPLLDVLLSNEGRSGAATGLAAGWVMGQILKKSEVVSVVTNASELLTELGGSMVAGALAEKYFSPRTALNKADKAYSVWMGSAKKDVLASFKKEQEQDQSTISVLNNYLEIIQESANEESPVRELNSCLDLLMKIVEERASWINQLERNAEGVKVKED